MLLGREPARHCRAGCFGSLSIGVQSIDNKQSTTHVEAVSKVLRDVGSIPTASSYWDEFFVRQYIERFLQTSLRLRIHRRWAYVAPRS